MANKKNEAIPEEEVIAGANPVVEEAVPLVTSSEPTQEELAKLQAASDEAEAKLKAATPEEKMVPMSQVQAMFDKFKQELKHGMELDEDDEIDGDRKHTIRIPRFNKKFIVAFKNLNDDPYFPNKVIYAQNIFDEKLRQMIPHVTFVFEDESTITMPFETMVKVADSKTACEIIKRQEVDASVKYGSINKRELKGEGYNEVDTGEMVQGKQIMKKYSFLIKFPDGHEGVVQPEVVNW